MEAALIMRTFNFVVGGSSFPWSILMDRQAARINNVAFMINAGSPRAFGSVSRFADGTDLGRGACAVVVALVDYGLDATGLDYVAFAIDAGGFRALGTLARRAGAANIGNGASFASSGSPPRILLYLLATRLDNVALVVETGSLRAFRASTILTVCAAKVGSRATRRVVASFTAFLSLFNLPWRQNFDTTRLDNVALVVETCSLRTCWACTWFAFLTYFVDGARTTLRVGASLVVLCERSANAKRDKQYENFTHHAA